MSGNKDLPGVIELATRIDEHNVTIDLIKGKIGVLDNERWELQSKLSGLQRERAVLAHKMVAKLDILPRETMASTKNGKLLVKPIEEPMTEEQIKKVGEAIDLAAKSVGDQNERE
jgi:hypothetical protein